MASARCFTPRSFARLFNAAVAHAPAAANSHAPSRAAFSRAVFLQAAFLRAAFLRAALVRASWLTGSVALSVALSVTVSATLTACSNLAGAEAGSANNTALATREQAQAASRPVFPGAEGFGTHTVAGRGGQVIKVTTLAASGEGSLQAALSAQGPRIIVFEVGGVIDLNKGDLTLNEPFVTIAGQTAPSPGITVIRGGMEINTHDVLMQHIRFRIGDAGSAPKSGFEKDVSINGANAYNVVVDHCSVAWGTDENLSVSGPRYDGPGKTARSVTLSHNIVAEGLYNASHRKGVHSMGSLIHDNVLDVAVVKSLYAHNNERNPWYKGNTTGVIANNFIHNPGTWAVRLGYVPGEWSGRTLPGKPKVTVVGNHLQHGTNTPSGVALVGTNYANGEAYLADNLAYLINGQPAQQVGSGITVLGSRPSWPADGLTLLPASQTKAYVLAHAGARPKDRDAVDQRIVSEAATGTGSVHNSQNEVGGYPQPAPTRRALTVPPADQVEAWLNQMAAELE